ncbi:MAG: hypothetical protein ACYDEZ_06050 [Methanoregula sp.]|jgi:hypothetical protein
MEHFTKIFIILSIFLIIGVSLTGCTDNSDQTASGSTPDNVAVTTTTGALYTAGDIVRSATGGDSPAWLVISYDSAGDSYTRALIYRNADGTWGYRVNSKTETSQRAMMEKVYTVKITHVTVSSVPTAAPTTVTTVVTTTATRTTTTTAVAVTTTISSARPSIRNMNPGEGEAGTTVTTKITGSDFLSNLTALLHRSGETSITATEVTVSSDSSMTCTFDLPNTTTVGTWDIVVTNPNGLSGEITNYFLVHGNKTAE